MAEAAQDVSEESFEKIIKNLKAANPGVNVIIKITEIPPIRVENSPGAQVQLLIRDGVAGWNSHPDSEFAGMDAIRVENLPGAQLKVLVRDGVAVRLVDSATQTDEGVKNEATPEEKTKPEEATPAKDG